MNCLSLLEASKDINLIKDVFIVLVQYLASDSSRESKFSHNVEMMLSYLLGYLRKIS